MWLTFVPSPSGRLSSLYYIQCWALYPWMCEMLRVSWARGGVEVSHSRSSCPKLSVTPKHSLLPQTFSAMTNPSQLISNINSQVRIDSFSMPINTALHIPDECCLANRLCSPVCKFLQQFHILLTYRFPLIMHGIVFNTEVPVPAEAVYCNDRRQGGP